MTTTAKKLLLHCRVCGHRVIERKRRAHMHMFIEDALLQSSHVSHIPSVSVLNELRSVVCSNSLTQPHVISWPVLLIRRKNAIVLYLAQKQHIMS